ncbi:hypothetical protein M9Y10_033334 [Tritrichomonas musculus]|uniref:Myb-like DNA-binding domain containing protein n=1 Tax=Tritrichomonas musculus TaxID=1915356 RepID=A0ABR2KCM7_9EUKA
MFSYPFENVMIINTPVLNNDYLHFHKRMEDALTTLYDNDVDSFKDFPKLNVQEPISRKKFTPEEDNELIKQAKIFGARKWDLIAKFIPNRTAKQCRDRYKNYLSPNIFHGEWSNEEDLLILEKIKEIGPQWSTIATILKNRTSNSVKNRAKYLIKNKFNPGSSTSSFLALQVQDKSDTSSDEQAVKLGSDDEKISSPISDSSSDNNSEPANEITDIIPTKSKSSGYIFPPIPSEYRVSLQSLLL